MEILIKLLAALTTRLNRRHKVRGERSSEQNTLFGLAEEIREVLGPIKPATSFRKDLRNRLEMIAQKRVILEPRRRRPWVPFLAAAVVGSALSVVGFLAYFLTSRLGRRSQTTS